jgi:hypothetical protein
VANPAVRRALIEQKYQMFWQAIVIVDFIVTGFAGFERHQRS